MTASAAAAMPERLGSYEILQRIAVGGMAEIYLARVSGISGFEKLVVVKRILPQLATSPEFVQMFLDEARIAATLHHSNIVQVYDVGTVGGQYFFSMEFLHGEDLSGISRALAAAGRPLPVEAALGIASGVCAGLHYAHERIGLDGQPLEIVHRDVSPQNVIVTFDGGVKLLDFGIAKAARRLAATRCGTLKGKVRYMSPEQCQGAAMDRRSDVFSLGILLWELTTGRRLFARSSEFETLKAIVETDAPAPSSVRPDYPLELERVVMRALRRHRAERYQTAQDMQLDLEEFARENKLSVSPILLGRLMHELFSERIEAWHAVRGDDLTLAEWVGTVMKERQAREADEVPPVDELAEVSAPRPRPEATTDPTVDPIDFRETVPLGPPRKPPAAVAGTPRRGPARVIGAVGAGCLLAVALVLGGWRVLRRTEPALTVRSAVAAPVAASQAAPVAASQAAP
ncbi:MAG: serine/threonine protein kinase, partial [Deltaproteobacteria bacterium]|nr:serine/threonine protein kinase [Deltaproteobacteria bacterium]